MNNQYDNTADDYQSLKIQLDRIENKLDTVLQALEIMKTSNQKLDNHIDFIEKVYANLRNPLNFICDKVSIFSNLKAIE